MNEIPRLYHHNMILVNTPSQVAPARPITDKPQSTGEQDRRKQPPERRKRNKKPVVERRVSSDRRGTRFEAKA
ncbi:hypothetical protein [Methylophaga thiooxydans]|nr:hypothetical protein [Methylophaga thiooxydans]